jgi:hypothetical protein
MKIENEIIEVSQQMIETLEENGFFEESQFLNPDTLKTQLQIDMQTKFETEDGDFILSDTEFLDCVNKTISNSVSETIMDLVEKGAIDMSIDPDGEILYSANKDFNTDDL